MQSSEGNPNPIPQTSSTVHFQSFSRGAPRDRRFTSLPTSTLGSQPSSQPPNPPLDRRQVQSASWHPSRNESQTTPHLQPSGSLDTRFSSHSQHSTPENSRRAASRTGKTLDFFGETSTLRTYSFYSGALSPDKFSSPHCRPIVKLIHLASR